jgi:chromosome segregation ATPase
MDPKFLEFWGNFLLHAAKGQRQLDELNQWMKQGLKGFEDLTSMFRKHYGLDGLAEDHPDFLADWNKASENFRKSFREAMGLMNVVSLEEHLKLVKKYEDLKEKSQEQEETVRHLRMLLNERAADQNNMADKFQDLIKKQTDEFQNFMRLFGPFPKKE